MARVSVLAPGAPVSPLELDLNLSSSMLEDLRRSSVVKSVRVVEDVVFVEFVRPSFKAFRLVAGMVWLPHLRVSARSKALLENVRQNLLTLACQFMPSASLFKDGERKLPKGESFDGRVGMTSRWMHGLRRRSGKKLVNWLMDGWLELTKAGTVSEEWRPDLIVGNPCRRKSKGWYAWQSLRAAVKLMAFPPPAESAPEGSATLAEVSVTSLRRGAKELAATRYRDPIRMSNREFITLVSAAIAGNSRTAGLVLFDRGTGEENSEKCFISSRMTDLLFYAPGRKPRSVLTSEYSQLTRSRSLKHGNPSENLGLDDRAVRVAAASISHDAPVRSRPWQSKKAMIVQGAPTEWSLLTTGSADPRFVELTVGPLKSTPRAGSLIALVEVVVGRVLPLSELAPERFEARLYGDFFKSEDRPVGPWSAQSFENFVLARRISALVELACSTMIVPSLYRQFLPKSLKFVGRHARAFRLDQSFENFACLRGAIDVVLGELGIARDARVLEVLDAYLRGQKVVVPMEVPVSDPAVDSLKERARYSVFVSMIGEIKPDVLSRLAADVSASEFLVSEVAGRVEQFDDGLLAESELNSAIVELWAVASSQFAS